MKSIFKKKSPTKKDSESFWQTYISSVCDSLNLFFENKIVTLILGIIITLVGVAFLALKSVTYSFILVAFFLLFYLKVLRKKKFPNYFHISLFFAVTLVVLNCPYADSLVRFVGVDASFASFIQPVLLLIVLKHVLFNDFELSVIYLLFISILATLLNGGDMNLFVLYFISGFVAVVLCSNVRRRFDLIRAGVVAGFVQSVLMVVSSNGTLFSSYYLDALRSGVLNGIVSVVIVIGVSGVFEHIFGQVTNISLLELSDFNNPILRKMILEAPGTYQHSLVVANLAEAAAEAIGANSLLARVGAYYHDIGKLSKAEYFSENQMLAAYRDRHKKLSPSMSTLIIMNHVKEGIDLARKYHMNRRIIDFIEQHHGTTLVYYFFAKAQQQQQLQKKAEDEPQEEVYRYPGPKPQTKEVAIVHLADTIEARSRTLDDPTPSRIKEMVKESTIKKFLDGQLDETDITLHDIDTISAVFVRMLNAMFHTRVDYQKMQDKVEKDKSKGQNGNSAGQQTSD